MIDTLLFDLDGTLLQFSQNAFIGAYFAELKKALTKIGLDADLAVQAVWAGTKAMIQNDGSQLNTQRFWQGFAEFMGLAEERLREVEAACDSFYTNEFNIVKSIVAPTDIPKRLVRAMAAKGFVIVLATNPLFPLCAVESRLNWAGLLPQDFRHITHYANSTFCKPNPEYYREVFAAIGKAPQQCMMIGNNPVEDMCAGALGAETFLVTDCLENEAGVDISEFRQGTLAELEAYLNTMLNA